MHETTPVVINPLERLAWMRSEPERLKAETQKPSADQVNSAQGFHRLMGNFATLPERLERELDLSTSTTAALQNLAASMQSALVHQNKREERTQSLIKSTDRRQRARGYRRNFAPMMDLVSAAKKWRGARDAV